VLSESLSESRHGHGGRAADFECPDVQVLLPGRPPPGLPVCLPSPIHALRARADSRAAGRPGLRFQRVVLRRNLRADRHPGGLPPARPGYPRSARPRASSASSRCLGLEAEVDAGQVGRQAGLGLFAVGG
jgi:hypothetical protein